MMFSFRTNEVSYDYCLKILKAMTLLYDVNMLDGLKFMNSAWRDQDFLGAPERDDDESFDLRYHETYWYWAAVLCNPNPCTTDDRQVVWKQRKDEANRRLLRLNESNFVW